MIPFLQEKATYLAIFAEQIFQIGTVGSQGQAGNEEVIARVQVHFLASGAHPKSSVVKRLIQCHLQQMNTYGGSRERERLRYRLSWPRMGERERERLRGLRPRSSG